MSRNQGNYDIRVGEEPLMRFTVTDEAGDARDISGATTLRLQYEVPNQSALALWTAGFETTGADGVITFQAITTTFATVGDWRWRARYLDSAGKQRVSEWDRFSVGA